MCVDKKESGFTLVELAIALMVIGLLIGGVLKGQELIENARITRTIKDIKDFNTAVMIFRSTYNGLPGDFKYANRLPNCNTAPCNITIPSLNGNGKLDYVTSGTSYSVEHYNFWLHLYNTGLISSIASEIEEDNVMYGRVPSISPQNPFNGLYYVNFVGQIPTQDSNTGTIPYTPLNEHVFHVAVNTIQASKIDYKIDDGAVWKGHIRISNSCPFIQEDASISGSNYIYNHTESPQDPCPILFLSNNF